MGGKTPRHPGALESRGRGQLRDEVGKMIVGQVLCHRVYDRMCGRYSPFHAFHQAWRDIEDDAVRFSSGSSFVYLCLEIRPLEEDMSVVS